MTEKEFLASKKRYFAEMAEFGTKRFYLEGQMTFKNGECWDFDGFEKANTEEQVEQALRNWINGEDATLEYHIILTEDAGWEYLKTVQPWMLASFLEEE